MTVMGLIAILFIFLAVFVLGLVNPSVVGAVTGFAQIVVASIGGLVAVYSGAQAAVDYRNASALASIAS
jgi:hypothetical protein